MSRELSRAFLDSIIITAVEGGIDYWATVSKYKWHDENEDDTFVDECVVADCEAPEVKYKVDAEAIAGGIQLILDGGQHFRSTGMKALATAIMQAISEGDIGNLDAGDCDCILQAAIFGQVIFG